MPETNQDDPAKLRDKLDAALASNKALKAENTILNSGMGHLNEHQRRAMISHIGKEDVTADSLKKAATDLGFPTEPPSSTPPPSSDANGNNDANNGNPPANNAPPEPPPDPSVVESLDQLDDMERAHIMQMRRDRGVHVSTEDYDKAINDANSAEEIERIVETMGPSVGIMSDKNIY